MSVSNREVHVLPRRWREDEGVVSELLPSIGSGGRMEVAIPERILTLFPQISLRSLLDFEGGAHRGTAYGRHFHRAPGD